MSDEVVIVNKHGQIYLGGPPLVKAATGDIPNPQELGGAKMHCTVSGVTDHFARNERHALTITRDIVANLPNDPDRPMQPYTEPLYSMEDIEGILPKSNYQQYDPRQVIARIVDGSRFHEFKPDYARELVTGFANFYGMTVGIIANIGAMNAEEALKGAHFIELCDQRRIPLLFLQNISGFSVGVEHEQGGIAKHGAKMVTAVSTASVPKITLIVGGSHGAGNYGMCGRAYSPRFLYMWPNAKISVMSGENAAIVLSTVEDGKEFANYVKSEETKVVNSFVEEVKAALSTWLKDKDDATWTKRTGMESDILPAVAERAGDAWDNLR
jgi:3-methylcrotonyl-CoA carboxylase beta subunit